MKTVNLHVGELLSPLGALGVEKQLTKLDGVPAARVNPVSGCATVTYDERRIAVSAIEEAIERCGHHCAGALEPKHLCDGPELTRGDATPRTNDHTHAERRGPPPPQHRGAPANDHGRAPAQD